MPELPLRCKIPEEMLQTLYAIIKASGQYQTLDDLTISALNDLLDDYNYPSDNKEDSLTQEFPFGSASGKSKTIIIPLTMSLRGRIRSTIRKYPWIKRIDRFVHLALAIKIRRYYHPDDLTPYYTEDK